MINIKSFFITSLFTGSGKTTFTLGLLYLLKNNVISFKTGPDFLDPILHEKTVGKKSYNLDSFFLNEKELREHFYNICEKNKSDNIVIEGAMGLLDGVRKSEASCDDIASKLKMPVILLVESYPTIHTIGSIIKGIQNSAKSQIKAVIITKSKSQKMFDLQKEDIINETGINNVYRFPYDENMKIEGRYLGLNIHENKILEVSKNAAELIKNFVDVEEIGFEIEREKLSFSKKDSFKNRKKIAISKDEAFSFLYEDNLDYFEEKLIDVIYFSPIHDKIIPEADFYYFTGGYPELFLKELSQNQKMLKSVKELCFSSKPVIAECGGFMYLSNSINDYNMVGFFNCESFMKKKMYNIFGYQNIYSNFSDFYIKGHEFHYSDMIYNEEKNAFNIIMESSRKKLLEGILKHKTLGSYSHLYLKSNQKEELLWEYL